MPQASTFSENRKAGSAARRGGKISTAKAVIKQKAGASCAAPINPDVPNIEAIGQLLYTRYLFVFEGAGLVLLVAMIGAIVLTYRQRGDVHRQNVNRQINRRAKDATRNTQPPVGQGVEL